MRHIVAEALVYPDLKSKELMDFYHCYDISEMPLKVFHRPGRSTVRYLIPLCQCLTYKKDEDSDEVKEAKTNNLQGIGLNTGAHVLWQRHGLCVRRV